MERRSLTRRSFLASAMIGAGMVAGCGSAGTSASGSAEQEMDRAVDLESDEVIEKMVEVEYSDAGTYTVAFTEANLIKDNVVAKAPEELTPMIAPASGEEMSRDISDVEQLSEGGAAAAGSSSAAATAAASSASAAVDAAASADGQAPAAEGQPAAEGEAATPEEFTVQPADQDQVVADAKAGSFAAVTREGVRVAYNAPLDVAEGEELKTEERIAPIASFSNDGTTITVSFANADAQQFETTYYTVAIDSLASCAVVHASRPTQEVAAVDEQAQLAELEEYKPDFSKSDIKPPEGVEISGGQITITADAPEPVVAALEGDPALAEGEMSRDAASDKEKSKWDDYDAVAQYTPEYLSFVSSDAAKVAEYGKPFYDIVKGYSTGDLASTLGGTLGVLKMCGIGKGSSGVTNEQILAEVKALRADVDDLRGLTGAMFKKLDEAVQAIYAGNLNTFDDAVTALSTCGNVAEDMLRAAHKIAVEQGKEVPGENATPEEEHAYYDTLVEIAFSQEDQHKKAFRSFKTNFEKLDTNFILVAGELAKPANFNPLYTYKKYWDTYFNFETQSWWLCQAYRSNIEYQLKRAYALLTVYYNIGDPTMSEDERTHDSYAGNLAKALSGMQNVPMSKSRDDVRWTTNDVNVYSGTLQRTIRRMNYTEGDFAGGPRMEKSVPMRLVEKLHGRTLFEDLDLSGLNCQGNNGGYMVTNTPTTEDYGQPWGYAYRAGIGFNANRKGSGDIHHDILDWNGEWHSDVKTYKKVKDWYGHTQHEYDLVFFCFE